MEGDEVALDLESDIVAADLDPAVATRNRALDLVVANNIVRIGPTPEDADLGVDLD